MGMTGFFCQDDYLEKTAKLTDTELGQLFRALMAYHKTGEITELEGRGEMAFDFIKTDIDRDEKAYQKKCDQARANRLKGTEQTSTDVNGRQPPSTDVNGSEQYNINKNKKEIENKNKELSDRFDRFWTAYPRKVAKPDARKKFEKLNPDEELLQTMLTAIEKQKRSDQWTRDGGQYIPHPSTWLNQRRWEDEVQDIRPAAITAQGYTQRDYAGEQEEALRRMIGGIGKGVVA